MEKKLELPKSYKEVSRAKVGKYWIVVIYSKKLGRAYAFKYNGIDRMPTQIHDITY